MPRHSLLARERDAYVWLGLLMVVLLAWAIAATWHGVWNVDNRTYLEMVDGVKRHGLPYTTNGDFEQFRSARAPFEMPAHGKLWGQYPPFYPYVAAPALALGGVPGTYRLNVLLVAGIALAAFALARRVWGAPREGVAAAYVVVLSSPTWAASVETASQPLLTFLMTLATLAAVAVVDAPESRRRWLALGVGAIAGLAVETHLIGLPPMAVLCLALAFVPAPIGVRSFLRSAIAFGAMGLVVAPLAVLNAHRFGTPNPISYGRCIWENCKMSGATSLGAGVMLTWAAPATAWIVATATALVIARRSRRATMIVAAVCLAALLPPWIVRERVFAVARTLWAYAVDVSSADVRMPNVAYPWFGPAADGLGNMHVGPGGDLQHGTALKALLQSSPVLVLAALAGFGRTGQRARALLCLLPAAGLGAELSLNGCFHGATALGWPFLFPRYVIPAVPMLAVLAVGAARSLPWRTRDFAPAAVLAIAGLVFFVPRLDDAPWARRLIELRATLVFAAAAVVFTLAARYRPRWSRAGCVAVSAAFGVGLAISIGVDTRILVDNLDNIELRVQRFAELTPQRFALAGWGPDTDPILSLRASRDIEYVDFTEAPEDWAEFRRVLDYWAAEDRPVFGALPPGYPFVVPYPPDEVPVEVLDAAQSFGRVGPPRRPAAPAP